MAFQIPTDFAKNYAGAAAGGGSSVVSDFIKEHYPTVKESFSEDLKNSVRSNIDPVLNAWATDVDNWTNLDFENINNPATAFMQFKNTISMEGGKKLRYAKKNNLLDPLAYINTYNQQMQTLAPNLAEKLNDYQIENKLDMRAMQTLVAGNPGLVRVLKQFGNVKKTDAQGIPNPVWEMMHPEETTGEAWQRFGKSIPRAIEGLTKPSGAITTGVVGAGLYGGHQYMKGGKVYKNIGKVYKGLVDKHGGPQNKLIKMLSPYAANKTAGQMTRGILKGAGMDDKTAAVGQEMTEGAMAVIQRVIAKNGTANVLKVVAKKLGWKVAAKTVGKGVLGAVGTVGTYGIGTGVMAAWLAKDLWDVYRVIKDMDVEGGFQRLTI